MAMVKQIATSYAIPEYATLATLTLVLTLAETTATTMTTTTPTTTTTTTTTATPPPPRDAYRHWNHNCDAYDRH